MHILCLFDGDRSSIYRDSEVTILNFWYDKAKIAISPNMSESTGVIYTKFSALIYVCVGMINLKFFLLLPKGRCYGNQLILGAFCRPRN